MVLVTTAVLNCYCCFVVVIVACIFVLITLTYANKPLLTFNNFLFAGSVTVWIHMNFLILVWPHKNIVDEMDCHVTQTLGNDITAKR